MSHDHIAKSRRKQRRTAALPFDAACVTCGVSTIEMLVKGSTVPVSLLEDHHVFGAAHHPLTCPLCRNHHAVVTAAQRNEGAILQQQASFLEQLANMLLSLGALLGEVGKALIAIARELLRRYRLVKTPDPVWRDTWNAD
jgi:hypothetical protein